MRVTVLALVTLETIARLIAGLFVVACVLFTFATWWLLGSYPGRLLVCEMTVSAYYETTNIPNGARNYCLKNVEIN